MLARGLRLSSSCRKLGLNFEGSILIREPILQGTLINELWSLSKALLGLAQLGIGPFNSPLMLRMHPGGLKRPGHPHKSRVLIHEGSLEGFLFMCGPQQKVSV